MSQRDTPAYRPVENGGDPYGTHRAVIPPGGLPQPAWRLDNDFSRLFSGELLLAADALNIDAASFAQIAEAARHAGAGASGLVADSHEADPLANGIAHIVLRTVADRGKQHNPVTGSGGMLLGRVIQIAAGRRPESLAVGDRVATLVSLTLTPLRIDRVRAVRIA